MEVVDSGLLDRFENHAFLDQWTDVFVHHPPPFQNGIHTAYRDKAIALIRSHY
jgi:hypothetical protein